MIRNVKSVDEQEFRHICALLNDFETNYGRGNDAPDPGHLDMARLIENAAHSGNKQYRIEVREGFHTHPPHANTTFWFTLDLFNGDDDPREFHVYVDLSLWSADGKGVLFARRVTHANDPVVPAGAPGAIASWTESGRSQISWLR